MKCLIACPFTMIFGKYLIMNALSIIIDFTILPKAYVFVGSILVPCSPRSLSRNCGSTNISFEWQ